MEISINQLEAAINYWRQQLPAQGDAVLCAQAAALSKPYALLILHHQRSIALEQLEPAARQAFEDYLSRSA